jgi:hypothetical protein
VDRHIVEKPKLLIWLENTYKHKEKKKRKEKKKNQKGRGRVCTGWGVKGKGKRRREHICSILLSKLFSEEKDQETTSPKLIIKLEIM